MLLKISTKAMNDTIDHNGLVPSLLVFGVIPRFPILCSEFPTQRERMKILSEARIEMNTTIAEKRIATALQKNVTSAADRVYMFGDEVLVYEEKEKKWIGPYIVKKVNHKIATISNGSYTQKFNVQQLKPYYRILSDPEISEVLYHTLHPFKSKNNKNSPPASVLMTEVIHPSDPRSSEFGSAKSKE